MKNTPVQTTDNISSAAESETTVDTGKAPKAKKRRRRLGDRRDGRRVRTLAPMTRVACCIMEDRTGASNRVRDRVEVTQLEKYVREKRAAGMKSFTMMHVIIAAYVRVVAGLPSINRFIAGHNIFARNNVEISIVIKKEMTLESPDTVLKIRPERDMIPEQIYKLIQDVIEGYRNDPGGDFDETAKFLSFLPTWMLLGAIRFLRGLDYIGLLPKFLCDLSPFHASMFITSMGSLGIPAIYHHLYDFGNCPVFIAFGAKERCYELNSKGEAERHEYVEYTVMMDERLCDGFYYATAMKRLRRYLRDPWLLDTPPEEVVDDVD